MLPEAGLPRLDDHRLADDPLNNHHVARRA